MGRSRKKQSKALLSDKNLHRYGIVLTALFLILVLTAVLLVFGYVKEGRYGAGLDSETADYSDRLHQQQDVVIEPDTKEYHYNFGGSILEKDAHHEINQLMEDYFRAVSQCDMDTFMKLFTSQDMTQEEQFRTSFEKQREYIEGYENISCYTADGLTEHTYVVYVSYNVKFSGVATPAPSLVEVYAEKCSDGQWRIFDGEATPELTAYLEAVRKNEDVVLLGKQIDQAKEEAMVSDEALRNRILFMENGPDYMKDGESTETQGNDGGQVE